MRLWLIVLACAGLCPAAEFFVAPADKGGDDAHDGSEKSPFASIKRGLEAAKENDTLTLRAGNYFGVLNLQTPRLTLRAAENEKAVLTLKQGVSDDQNVVRIVAEGVTLRGIEITGGRSGVRIEGENALLDACRIHATGHTGVRIAGGHAARLQRCEIGPVGTLDAKFACGIQVSGADGVLIQDCYVHDVPEDGVLCSAGSMGLSLERCVIHRCRGIGVVLGDTGETNKTKDKWDCRGASLRNCFILETRNSGVAMNGACNCEIVHCTLVSVATGKGAGLRLADARYNNESVLCEDITFANNIVVLGGEVENFAVRIGPSGYAGALKSHHNRFSRDAGKCVFAHEKEREQNLTLAQWQQKFSLDENSSEGDAGLDANYHLLKGSPCIETGAPVEKLVDDFDGALRDKKKPDIGADEFGEGSVLPVPPPAGAIGTGGGIGAGRRNMPEKERAAWFDSVFDKLEFKHAENRKKIIKLAQQAWDECVKEDKAFAETSAKIRDDRDLLAFAREDYRKRLRAAWDNCDIEISKKKLLSDEQLTLWKRLTRDVRE